MTGSEGECETLSLFLRVTGSGAEALEFGADLLAVVGPGDRVGGAGEFDEACLDGGDEVGLVDAVGVAGAPGEGAPGVAAAAEGGDGAVLGGHWPAAAGAVDEAAEGMALASVGAGTTAAALAEDGAVGFGIPQGGEAVAGVGGGGGAPHDEAGVGVVVHDVAEGAGGPLRGAAWAVGGGVELAADGVQGVASEVEVGDEADGGRFLGVEFAADAAAGGGIAEGAVAGGPVGGVEPTAGAGGHSEAVAANPYGLFLSGADGLDGVEVAQAGGRVADGVGCGGHVQFGAGFLDQADDLLGQGGIAAEAVYVDGVEDVEGVALAVVAELAVGGHGGFGLVPEDEVAAVAGHGVDADDGGCASRGGVEGRGETAACRLLLG